MKTIYDTELLANLCNEINEGIIKIHENTSNFFEEIENYFPTGFSGIDWATKKCIFYYHIKNNEEEIRRSIFESFFEKISYNYPELLKENIVLLGDGLTNLGYEMKFYSFIMIYYHFFDLPQHSYVWFQNNKKCINFTFEGDLYFG